MTALALVLVAAVSYGVNAVGAYAETHGWSLKSALILEIALAAGCAAMAGVVWAASPAVKVAASWLCLASVVRAGWSAWLLARLLIPGREAESVRRHVDGAVTQVGGRPAKVWPSSR